ncbi:MAG: HD-GYP domain-containing protein [Desulfotomaculales bacterium]
MQRACMAGLLHDLGKLSVPEAVLNKPGPLDRRELNLVRGHSYYTYRILYRIPETREIAAWAGYHHERLDGRGYPFGLAVPEIDTGARLLAAADVFVALVEDRPYRAGLPRAGVEAVMREAVRSGALDATAVDVLLGSCDELIGRLRRLGH